MSLELPSCYQPAEAALVPLLSKTPSTTPGEGEQRDFFFSFWLVHLHIPSKALCDL